MIDPAIHKQPHHVLIIEEDPKQAELFSELVREVSTCKVDVMSRVESSFDWISRSNYHLVVIDVSKRVPSGPGGGAAPATVSGFDALQLLEQIKRISPITSVVLISDDATVEEAVAAIRMGAEDYLKTPFNLEAFQLAVKRGLDRKMVFGENAGVSSFLNLLNSCQMISASLEEGKIFEIIHSYLSRELNSGHSAIYTLQGGQLNRAHTLGGGGDRAMEEVLQIALHASNPMPGMAAAGEFYRFVDRGQLTPGLFVFRFQCTPGSDYYCVCLSPERPGSLESFEGRLRMLKTQIEVTGRNIEQYMGVQHLVYVDDATGLYNTRYLNYILDREIHQSELTQKSFAVLFIDADRFKKINDTHGHLVGTKLLHELGIQLKRFVREKDTVFRYGGDEFVAVLSPADLGSASHVAERIRAAIEQHPFLAAEGLSLRFTVSIGVAIFPDHADSKRAIIESADHAMYTSKKRSRNSVTIAEKPGASTPAAPTQAPPPGNAAPAAPVAMTVVPLVKHGGGPSGGGA